MSERECFYCHASLRLTASGRYSGPKRFEDKVSGLGSKFFCNPSPTGNHSPISLEKYTESKPSVSPEQAEEK